MSYKISTEGSYYSQFTNDEKIAYALNLSLAKVTTDAFKAGYEWYNSPDLFNAISKQSILSDSIPKYNEIKNYYCVITVNGIEYITNKTVDNILTYNAGFKLSEILQTNNDILSGSQNDYSDAPTSNDFNTNGLCTKLPRQSYAYFVYWKNKLTGLGANGNNPNGTSGGLWPHSDDSLSLKLTLNSDESNNADRIYDNVLADEALMNKLQEYIPLKIINPSFISGTINQTDGIPENLKQYVNKKIVINVGVPTISTWNGLSNSNNSDNIAFFNPLLTKSLSEAYGYKANGLGNGYWIRGTDSGRTNIRPDYGSSAVGEGTMIFSAMTGFILFFGVSNILTNSTGVSVKNPPVVTALKYTGETFADGIITQDISDNIPPPEVSNVKDLYIDTTNNLIYRLDQSGNEKSWVSVGGSGGAGGGASSDAVVKLETLETISRMGNEDSLVYQYTDSNELGKLSTNLVDIGVKQEILYNLDGTLSTTNTGYKWLSIHLHKDSSNNYYLNGSNYSEEISNSIQYIKLDEILRDNKLLDDDRITTLFNTASNNVVGFATVGMYGKKYVGDLKQQWNAFNNDWLLMDATSLSYASMRSNRHGCAYDFQTSQGMVIDAEQVDDDLRIMIGIYMENKNTDKSKIDGAMVIGKNYMTQYKPPVNGMLIEGNVGIGKITASTGLDVSGTITTDHITATSTATLASVDIDGGAINGTTIGLITPLAGKFTTLEATTSATLKNVDISGGSLEHASMENMAVTSSSIDNTTIGETTRSSGKFTTLEATTSATLKNVDISGGSLEHASMENMAVTSSFIDNTTIGETTRSSGKFTTLEADDNVTFTGGTQSMSNVDINGGAIDGTTIGETTPLAGKFTTLSANNNVTFTVGTQSMSNVDINGGVIDNTTIGETTPSNASFVDVNITDTLHVNGNTIMGSVGDEWDALLTLGGEVDAEYNTTYKIKLLIANGNNDGSSPYDILSKDENNYTNFFLKGPITENGYDGIMYMKGKIGIGTMEPSAKLDVSGDVLIQGNTTMNTVDINGGTIDNTTIGETTRSSGKFTTLEANDNVTFTDGTQSMSNVDINGGTIDNTVIGLTTPSDASFVHVNVNGDITIGEGASKTILQNNTGNFQIKHGGSSVAAISIINRDVYFNSFKIVDSKIGIGVLGTVSEKLEVNGNIKCDGKLGIGVTGTPSTKLHIKGTVNEDYITLEETGSTNYGIKGIIRLGDTFSSMGNLDSEQIPGTSSTYRNQKGLIIQCRDGLDNESSAIWLNGSGAGVVNPGDTDSDGYANTWSWSDEDNSTITLAWYINTGGSLLNTSDIRLKENIRYFDDEYEISEIREKYSNIKFCKFNWKKPLKDPSAVKQDFYGIIAQELEIHFPEMVDINKKSTRRMLIQERLQYISYYIIQDLLKENTEIKAKNTELENKVSTIEAELAVIKSHLGI